MAIYGHNFHVFIGDYNSGSSETLADLAASATAGAGDFGVADAFGTLLAATPLTSGDKFRVVQPHQDGSIRSTPLLDFNDIVRVKAISDSSSEAFQISNIGYTDVNTSNSIDVINSNRYTLRLQFINDTELYSEQKDQYFFEFVSDANTTEIEVANGIAQKMGKMAFADGSIVGPNRAKISVQRFSEATTEVNTSGSSTLSWSRGSDQVVASATHGVAVGMYIRQTTGVGVPVYKVVAVNGNNITLDMPSQETGAAAADSKTLTAAVVEASACGIKLTALAAYHKVGLYPYHVVSFEFQLDGFGSTTSDTSTASAKGNTNGEAIADMEWFGLSQDTPGGASFTGTGFPSAQSFAELQAKDGTDYDVMVIEYALSGANQPHAIANGGKVKGTIVVAFEAGSAGVAASFEDLFNGATGAGTALNSD
jgi:hypothetical protein